MDLDIINAATSKVRLEEVVSELEGAGGHCEINQNKMNENH